MKEHKDARSQGQWEKSAIAEHAWRHNHRIEWDDAAVIDGASRHKEVLVKEALQIRTAVRKNSLNKDRGVELHDCWVATVRRCETQVMAYHLGLECIKRPVLNATHCPEEKLCNLVEM